MHKKHEFPQPKPNPYSTRRSKRYSLAELVARCDPNAPISEAEIEWLEAPAVGLEEGAPQKCRV